MGQDYLARIAALEEALRQKDNQLSLVAKAESFLRSALTCAEEKIENEEREIEHLRAQTEKLLRMLFGTRSEKLHQQVEEAEALLKQHEQQSDRYNGQEDDPQVPRQLRQSRHRCPLPEHLPREIHRLEPSETGCPKCGGDMAYLHILAQSEHPFWREIPRFCTMIRITVHFTRIGTPPELLFTPPDKPVHRCQQHLTGEKCFATADLERALVLRTPSTSD